MSTQAQAAEAVVKMDERYVKLTELSKHRSRPAPRTLRRLFKNGEAPGVVVPLDGVLTVDLLALDQWMESRFQNAATPRRQLEHAPGRLRPTTP